PAPPFPGRRMVDLARQQAAAPPQPARATRRLSGQGGRRLLCLPAFTPRLHLRRVADGLGERPRRLPDTEGTRADLPGRGDAPARRADRGAFPPAPSQRPRAGALRRALVRACPALFPPRPDLLSLPRLAARPRLLH